MSVIAFDPTRDFQPLFADQTESVILARMMAWANEGLDPVADVDSWVDTREGSHWATATVPMVRELARLYDLAGTDVPMSGFVLWSWGTYLDDLAAVWDVTRLPAVQATGVLTFGGPPGTDIAAGTTVSAVPGSPDDPAPDFSVDVGGPIPGGGSIDFAITATIGGISGDVSANAVTAQSTPLPAGVTFTNAAPITGGQDPETDDALRARVLEAIAGKGPGTVNDYLRWAGEYPGVGAVHVVPIWNGPGTVLVMITDPNGLPLSSALVSGLQFDLDPTAGLGAGTAPIGAVVTVDTSTLLNLDVVATFVYETGYSWDGAGGTVAVGPSVQAGISAYLLGVAPGGSVVYEHVKGLCSTAQGVHDISGVTVNGGTANIAVGITPPQAPILNSFTAH